jgi:hypothetical protein
MTRTLVAALAVAPARPPAAQRVPATDDASMEGA